ncbi:hypothetical protein BH11MYX2_BH11MYX2_32710 [soil metagenome]
MSSAGDLARDGVVLLDNMGKVDASKAAFVAADGTRVAAKVVQHAGDKHHSQVLLTPVEDLPANATVHLAFGIPALDKELADRTLTTSGGHAPGIKWRREPRV